MIGAVVRVLADPVTGEQGRQAAERELGRPEYHRDDRSLVQRFLDWLADRLSGTVGGHSPTTAIVVLTVLVALVILIALWRAGALPGVRRRRKRAAADQDPLAPQAATDHAAIAARLEADGRLAEALREWLRAAVRTLEDRAVLDPVPGRTGTRTAREAATLMPEAATPLTEATSAFEQVWFGGRATTGADVALARQAAAAVREAHIQRGARTGFAVPR